MTRIQPIDYERSTGKVRGLLDALNVKLGMVPNMVKTMARSPAVLDAYLSFSGALGSGRLNGKLREQLALAVAAINGCDYCASAHAAIGAMVGLGPEAIRAARQGRATDARTDAALKFARTVIVNRGRIGDADIGAVREAGYDDGEITEIVAHVALNIFTNYFNLIAGTEVDFPPVRLAATA